TLFSLLRTAPAPRPNLPLVPYTTLFRSLGISGSVQVMNQIQYYERKMQELYTPRAQKLPLNKKLNQWQKSKENIQQKEQQEEQRSEEHTSELQSRFDLVCRLLLEKKNKI